MYETPLEEFQATAKIDRANYNAIVSWHLQAYSSAGIPLPYRPNATSITVDFSDPVYPDNRKPEPTEDDPENWVYDWSRKIDESKTIEMLSKVTKFARQCGYKVEKDYDYDFSIIVTIPAVANEKSLAYHPEITISYNCDREAVCVKKVVGTKVVPAHTTPERIEEVVEWDCQKIAFTS